MSPGHGHGHGHGHDDDEEDDTGEWMQLMRPRELRELLQFDIARKGVERQIIHNNQAKLAGRSEAERRGRTPSSQRVVGAGGVYDPRDDSMGMYSKLVQANHLVKLLPRPGDGDKQEQLLSQKVVNFLVIFLSGSSFAMVSILVTIFSVELYLYETTLIDGDDGMGGGGWFASGRHNYPFWFAGVEYFLLAFFGAELGLRAILADVYRSFWLSSDTVVEVLCVLPSVLFVMFNLRLWGFLRFLRLLRWVDIGTIVDSIRREKEETSGRVDENPVSGPSMQKVEGVQARRRESMVACFGLLAFVTRYVLVYAGCVTLLGRAVGGVEDLSSETGPPKPITFAAAVYMAAMMLSTVGEGYGPVLVSPGARLASSIAVLVFLPLAAIRISVVGKHWSISDISARSVSRVPSVRERRVLICGSVNAVSLQARLREIFHPYHGNHNVRWVRVVVMSPDPPSRRMAALLRHPHYRSRVTYIEGCPLHDDSLLKAHADEAAAVMVLANKAPASSHAEDMNVSLQAISVLTHVEPHRRQGGGPRLLVELVDPNAALHLKAAGIRQVVSSAQVKLSVLAQSCLCPGWAAVVANLLESRNALPPQVLQQGSWLAEYYVGANKTFYSVEFSPAFTGVLFSDAVVHIFEYFELILVAVETKRYGGGGGAHVDSTVVVNPAGDHRIGKGDRGFVLAESQRDARVIWDYMTEGEELSSAGEGVDRLKERFSTPEEEEALAMETLGTAGVAGMGPRAFVDSMVYSRTLLHCQKKLPEGVAPDTGLILEWARQFQSSDGVSDEVVVQKALASVGLAPPPPIAVPRHDPYSVARAHMGRSAPSNVSSASTLTNEPISTIARPIGDRRELAASSPRHVRATSAAPRTHGFRGARERFMSDTPDEDLSIAQRSSSDGGRGNGGVQSVAGGDGGGISGAGGFEVGMRSTTSVSAPEVLGEADLLGIPRSDNSSSAPVDGSSLLLAAAALGDGVELGVDQESAGLGSGDDGVGNGEGVESIVGTAGTTMSRISGSVSPVGFAQEQQEAQLKQVGCSSHTTRAAGAGRGVETEGSPVTRKSDGSTGEEVLTALRKMDVSNLDGDEARRHLQALQSAAIAFTPNPGPDDVSNTVSSFDTTPTGDAGAACIATAGATATVYTPAASSMIATTNARTSNPVPTARREEAGRPLGTQAAVTSNATRTATTAPAAAAAPAGPTAKQSLPLSAPACRRKISTARHLTGHVVVMNFTARPSHLECFLRPLKGWTGGAGMGGGRGFGGGVPVVLLASDVTKLASALDIVDRHGYVNTSEVYLLEGSSVSRSDLENAGVRTAKAVLVMKDTKSKRFKEGVSGDPLRDAEALISFIKMEDGLLNDDQHFVVELESSANVRFLHARTETKSLKAIASLGGAGSGGAADEAHYLWPKYAAGMTYNSSFVDALFGQAFYRPSRIALIERLLLLDRGEQQGQSSMNSSVSQVNESTPPAARGSTRRQSVSGSSSRASREGSRAPHGGGDGELGGGCCLRQMAVPINFVGHSFGEMFQHLAAPPMRCVAFALLRARGTRSAPEPYVYTGPRADTVLHPGDKVFVLGKPPVL